MMTQNTKWIMATAGCLVALAVSPVTLSAQSGAGATRYSIQNVLKDDLDYTFLTLGVAKDYLRAERWRAIDQIEQAIPAIYEPRLPFHGYTLPPGARRIAVGMTVARNPGDFGTDEFYELFFDDVRIDFVKVNVDLFYGFEIGGINDLVLRLNVPYKFQRHSGTGHPFRIDPMLMTMEGSGEGIGDISVTVKKKWVDQANGPLNFSTALGVILPTAADNEQFNASQTMIVGGTPMMGVSAIVDGNPAIDIFGREAGDRHFPRIAQSGNGSWGGRFGLAVTRQFDRGAVHAGAVFDLLADNDGITPGNELKYGFSYVFPPAHHDRFAVDLSIFGRWKGTEKFPGMITHPERDPATGGPVMDAGGNMVMFTTARPDFEHGNATFVSPTFVLTTSPNVRLIFSPAIRVLEPSQGPSPRWQFTLGQTFTF
jgi:hypothetical protein